MDEFLRAAGTLAIAAAGCGFTALAFSRLARRGRLKPAPAHVPSLALAAGAAAFLAAQIGLRRLLPGDSNPAHPWNLAVVAGALLAALAALALAGGRARWILPLPERRPLRYALKAYAAALPAILGLYALYLGAAEWIGFAPEHEIVAGFDRLDAAERVLTLGFAVLLMPVLEEAVFRGFLFAGLAAEPRFGPLRALAFSSLVFGLAHHPAMWLPATGLGLLFGWVHWRVGDLRAPILMHALHNGLVFAWSAAG